MGRFEKSVLNADGINRRELGYYSTPGFIAKFITQAMLAINPHGTRALDPCVGREELIKDLYDHGVEIDGIDVHNHGDYFHCNFTQQDFISYYAGLKARQSPGQSISLPYDYIIANPPYNCHEVNYIRDNRNTLTGLFAGIGVHNMYSMFVSAMVDCAKDGALIGFITSDSFLTARVHASLRRQILDTCAIHYMVLCPPDLFRQQNANVRTCIMILQKGKQHQRDVQVLTRPVHRHQLQQQLESGHFTTTGISHLVNPAGKMLQFIPGVPPAIQVLFAHPRLAEHFACVSGISTGNDALYISKEKREDFSIPFYKNPGMRKFYAPPDGYLTSHYMEYHKQVKNFLVRNTRYLLREGITCSSMGVPFGACYMPAGSAYGVNANIFCPPEDIWWLMAYLNSSLVTYLVRAVLCRSNMVTSGYVGNIPLVPLSPEAKQQLTQIARDAWQQQVTPKTHAAYIGQTDAIIFALLALPPETEAHVLSFARNLQARV